METFPRMERSRAPVHPLAEWQWPFCRNGKAIRCARGPEQTEQSLKRKTLSEDLRFLITKKLLEIYNNQNSVVLAEDWTYRSISTCH